MGENQPLHTDAQTFVSMDPQSCFGLNKLQLRCKSDGEPPVVFRKNAVRKFLRQLYFWLAEKLCHEMYSKLFFFFGEQERLLAENKWWTFFESLTDWFSPAVWEVLALFIIFLRHPCSYCSISPSQYSAVTSPASSSGSSSSSLSFILPPKPWVILWTQYSLLWSLIVCKNINITLVILLTHILQMGKPFLRRMKRQFTGGKLDDGKQICNATG